MKNNDPALEQGEMSDEEIDVNLDGTFPASDPPSWTLGTDHRKELSDQEKDAQSKASTSERKAPKMSPILAYPFHTFGRCYPEQGAGYVSAAI